MNVVDFHCDALYKMTFERSGVSGGKRLDVTPERLRKGNVLLQCFAVFLPEFLSRPSFYDILRSVDTFHQRILREEWVKWVRSPGELREAQLHGKIGAMLTLEGVDGLEGDLSLLRHAFRLGVRIVGLTWNHANWAADGVMEPRGGGLTDKGKELVRECDRLGMICDVSHLSENAFRDLADIIRSPFIASHSNAYSICPHPRNLKDAQIQSILEHRGLVALTFVPSFLNPGKSANVSDLIRHIDHVCSLGGSSRIAFGSDFDGIDRWTDGLEHPGKYPELREILLKYYKEEEVEGFMWKNGFDFLMSRLPECPII